MCRVPGRVCGTLSTFTTPQDGDPRLHCRDKADNSQVGARAGPAHRDAGFAATGFAAAGFAAAGFAATGFAATGFAATGFAATGFAATGHRPDRMPTGDITEQATSYSADQPSTADRRARPPHRVTRHSQ